MASYNQLRSRFDDTYDREGHMLARKRDRVGQPSGGDAFKFDEYYRLAGARLGVEAAQFAQFTAQPPTLTFDQVSNHQSWTDYSPPGQELDKARTGAR